MLKATTTERYVRVTRVILVDTSVMIDYLKGRTSDKVLLLEEVLQRNIPFGISAFTYQEILQGARNEQEWETLKNYLSTQAIYYINPESEEYEKSARLYYELRRNGATPRSTIDVLIALTAMKNNLALLHDDKDFDIMADHIPELMILERF